MRKISIIHPSRSRPELAKKVYDEWIGKAAYTDNIEYVLSLDNTEDKVCDYLYKFLGENYHIAIPTPSCQVVISDSVIIKYGHNKSAIEAINRAAETAKGDMLIVVSDDFSCPVNWDTELLNRLDGRTDFCAKAQDGIQPWMMTMPIMDRVYYERYGFIYNPAYQHMYCDLELSCVADLTGKKIAVPMLFKHKHYSQPGGIKADEITKKNDSTYAEGERVFLRRAANNFDLNSVDIVGAINPDRNCYNWFKQKGVFV